MGKSYNHPTHRNDLIEHITNKTTHWIGTPQSILVHTLLFVGIFALEHFGFDLSTILLILTTVVSLEAIYLAIFIQMTVNRNTESLRTVEADIDEIQEDVEDLGVDVDEISEDIEEIQAEDDQNHDLESKEYLQKLATQLEKLLEEINGLKKSAS